MARGKAAEGKTGMVSARVLVAYDFNGVRVNVNDVIQCAPEFAAEHAGVLDATPEAVEYALSDEGGGKVVELEAPAEQ